jgi:AcrR family transcriptional regulator
MSSTRRIQTHNNTCEEIKTIAWEAIAEGGATALSLGAIARRMEMTTPALYRYFDNRDALISDLIGDAYASLTAALKVAIEDIDPAEHGRRFRELAKAYRSWAVENPQKYTLMFGSPKPINQLSERAGEKADESFILLLSEFEAADRDQKIDYSINHIIYTPLLKEHLLSTNHYFSAYSEKATYLALAVWSFIHGMVSLEISRDYAIILGDAAEDFFQLQVEYIFTTMGIK